MLNDVHPTGLLGTPLLSIKIAGPSTPNYGKTEYHFDGHVGHSSCDRTNLQGYFICQNSHNRSKPIFDNFRNMEKICKNEFNAIPDAVNLNELKEFRNKNLNRLRMEFHDLWRLWIPTKRIGFNTICYRSP